jgi:formate hydrogenlyase subunit 3
MSVIGLVNQAVAWYAASAVLAFLFALRKPLSGAIAGIGGAVASAMLVWRRRRAADAGAVQRRHAACF